MCFKTFCITTNVFIHFIFGILFELSSYGTQYCSQTIIIQFAYKVMELFKGLANKTYKSSDK